MAHRRLNAIWANYTFSPDPSSGTPSLHQACLALTKHSLEPLDIIGLGAGFTLHPDLAQQVSDVCTAMDLLLRPAARHHFGESSIYIGNDLPYVLTGFLGERMRAPQSQIISHWVMLLDRLEIAMQELKNLCIGDPRARLRLERPSPYPRLVASLSPILQARLRPCDFEVWGMAVPLTVRSILPASKEHTATCSVSPPERSPHKEAATSLCSTTIESTQPVISPPERSPAVDAVDASSANSSTRVATSAGSMGRGVLAAAPGHAPVAAIPAAHAPLVIGACALELGGLDTMSCQSAKSIVIEENLVTLTSRNVLKNDTKDATTLSNPTSKCRVSDSGSRVPGICSKSSSGDHALEAVSTPSSKSPAPAIAIATAVEHGGLPVMEQITRTSGRPQGGGDPEAVAASARAVVNVLVHHRVDPCMTEHAPVAAAILAAVKDPPRTIHQVNPHPGNLVTLTAKIDCALALERTIAAQCVKEVARFPPVSCMLARAAPSAAAPRTAAADIKRIAVEPGGLKCDLQSAEFSRTADDWRLTQSHQNGSACGPPAPPRHLPSAFPAPELVVTCLLVGESSVELGGPRVTEQPARASRVPRGSSCEVEPKAVVCARTIARILLSLRADPDVVGHTPGHGSSAAATRSPLAPSQVELAGDEREIAEDDPQCIAGICRPSHPPPAPAHAVSTRAVELGGWEQSMSKADVPSSWSNTPRSSPQMRPLTIVSFHSPLLPVTVTRAAKAFALVSAIVRTTPASYLACIRRGELVPCLAWEREGIGTALMTI
ncbi:hypothetical protein B0H13DRAFT_1853856 [Mycena leptocephala]|nr:hypothetical protein B0H13DRAFT_1853856 [Mycena leptocephala]